MDVNMGLEIKLDGDTLIEFLDRMAKEHPDVLFYGENAGVDTQGWLEFRADSSNDSLLPSTLRIITAEIISWGYETLLQEGLLNLSLDSIGIEIGDYHLLKAFV